MNPIFYETIITAIDVCNYYFSSCHVPLHVFKIHKDDFMNLETGRYTFDEDMVFTETMREYTEFYQSMSSETYSFSLDTIKEQLCVESIGAGKHDCTLIVSRDTFELIFDELNSEILFNDTEYNTQISECGRWLTYNKGKFQASHRFWFPETVYKNLQINA